MQLLTTMDEDNGSCFEQKINNSRYWKKPISKQQKGKLWNAAEKKIQMYQVYEQCKGDKYALVTIM